MNAVDPPRQVGLAHRRRLADIVPSLKSLAISPRTPASVSSVIALRERQSHRFVGTKKQAAAVHGTVWYWTRTARDEGAARRSRLNCLASAACRFGRAARRCHAAVPRGVSVVWFFTNPLMRGSNTEKRSRERSSQSRLLLGGSIGTSLVEHGRSSAAWPDCTASAR